MDVLFGVVKKIGDQRYEEDKVDWANYQLTAYIFAASSVLITSYTYMGVAIKCWTPAEFRRGWIEYARDICLIENTYYVPIDDPEMPNNKYREEKEIPYYQWVPFVLVILAFFWYIPHLIWRSFNWWSGIQVRAIVREAAKTFDEEETYRYYKKRYGNALHPIGICLSHLVSRRRADRIVFLQKILQKREKSLVKVANHIYLCIYDRKKGHNTGSSTLTVFYLMMKALFLVNIIFQVIILHIFLGFDWGDLLQPFEAPAHLIMAIIHSEQGTLNVANEENKCIDDVESFRTKIGIQYGLEGHRSLSEDNHRYSVQCVLAQNMFNEKIFLVLFYWILFLFIVTLFNTLVWIKQIFFSSDRRNYTKRMLESAGIVQPRTDDFDSDKEFNIAEENYEKILATSRDAIVLYRLIASNAGDGTTSKLLKLLYDKVNEKKDD